MEKYRLKIEVSSSIVPNNSVDTSWEDEIKVGSLREAIEVATEKLKTRTSIGTKRCSFELTLENT